MSSITLWKRRERSRQHRRRSRLVAMKGKQKQIHSHFSNLSGNPTICVAFQHCTKSTQLCATPSEQLYVSVLRLSVFFCDRKFCLSNVIFENAKKEMYDVQKEGHLQVVCLFVDGLANRKVLQFFGVYIRTSALVHCLKTCLIWSEKRSVNFRLRNYWKQVGRTGGKLVFIWQNG